MNAPTAVSAANRAVRISIFVFMIGGKNAVAPQGDKHPPQSGFQQLFRRQTQALFVTDLHAGKQLRLDAVGLQSVELSQNGPEFFRFHGGDRVAKNGGRAVVCQIAKRLCRRVRVCCHHLRTVQKLLSLSQKLRRQAPVNIHEGGWGSWALIVFLFAIGIWPVALFLLFAKLFGNDNKNRQDYTAPPPLQVDYSAEQSYTARDTARDARDAARDAVRDARHAAHDAARTVRHAARDAARDTRYAADSRARTAAQNMDIGRLPPQWGAPAGRWRGR